MKLTISTAILSHVSSSLLNVAIEYKTTQENDTEHQTHKKEMLEQEASYFNIPIEDVIKKNKEKQESHLKTFINSLNFVENIKELSSKALTITKTEQDVTLEFNDDFIKGSIDLCFNMTRKFIPLFVTTCNLDRIIDKEIKEFNTKWELTPKFVKQEETSIEINGWSFVINSVFKPKATLINGSLVNIDNWVATKDEIKLDIYSHNFKYLNTDIFILEEKFPKDLIEAIRELYTQVYIK